MKNKVKIYYEIFYFLSISLAIFLLLEIILPNFVLAYFNINILLVLWFFDLFLILISNSFSLPKKDDK